MKSELERNIVIKKIDASEIDLFYDLFEKCLQAEFPEYSEKMIHRILNRPQSFTRQNIAFWLKTGVNHAFLGYLDNQLAGFILGRNVDHGVSQLSWLGILKGFQRKGLGRKLLETWEILVEEQGAHVVHVYSFQRDLPFYKKCGYSLLAIDEKSWFGVDHYILRKHLQEPKEENYLR